MLLDEHASDLLEQRVHRLQQDQLRVTPIALLHVTVGRLEVRPRRRDGVRHVRVDRLRVRQATVGDDELVGDVAGEGGQDGEHAEAHFALDDLPLTRRSHPHLLVQQQLVVEELQRDRTAPLLDVAHTVPRLR